MARVVWAIVVVGLCATESSAQPPVGPRPLTGVNTPAVSPYLNLLRPGTSPGINYYGLVRPQIDFQNSVQALQSQFGYAQQAAGLPAGDPGTTGHPVYFLNYNAYFLNTTGQPVAGGLANPIRQPMGGAFANTAGAFGTPRRGGR
jgi:hypothetical protein